MAAVGCCLAVIALLASACAASTWRTYGHTWDEPEHLAAGLQLLDKGRYEYDIQHPPLVRALIALGPFLAGAHSIGKPPPDGTQEGQEILYGSGKYDLYLTLARLGTLPFLPLLLYATWLWARQVLQSDWQSLLAVALVATVPPILGHGALATLDVPAAATTLLALYFGQRLLTGARGIAAVAFGVTAGIAIGTKLSAIPFLASGLAAGLLCIHGRSALRRLLRDSASDEPSERRPRINLITLAIAGMSIVTVTALTFGASTIHTLALPIHAARLSGAVARHGISSTGWHVPTVLQSLLIGAVSEFTLSLQALLGHNSAGHLSYLLGSTRTHGWWYFYAVALGVKTPLPLLAAGPAGLLMLAREGWRGGHAWQLAPLAVFAAILVFASLYSNINIGVRHVLVLYPFLAIGGAHCISRSWRFFSLLEDRNVAGMGCAITFCLCLWQMCTPISAHPDYLPYFNEAITHPEKVLVDSDLAWGQDLRRLEIRLAELKVPSLHLAYLGSADLKREPLPPTTPLPPYVRASGWIAVTALARVHETKGYAWLDRYSPVEQIGKSIALYFIPAPD